MSAFRRVPLTAPQHGLWLLQQLDPTNPVLSVGEVLEIHGAIDARLYRAAIRQVIAEAETLRIRIAVEDEEVFQYILEPDTIPVSVVDLSGEPDPAAAAEERMWAGFARTLDPTRDPLFAPELLKLAEDRYLSCHRFHHLAIDGWSMGLVARRLAERHGVRHLLLTGRQGPAAPGAERLRAELSDLGAEVTVVAADVADAGALAALLAAVPGEHPLTGVVHAAGVLDDSLLDSLTPDRLAALLRPKAQGALNLHRATEHLDLAAFVLFSSAVGLLGNPGQAGYAAANTYLDGLAQHRRTRGLPAVSLAWGHWAEAGGLAGALTRTERERLARTGLAPMDTEYALGLFDSALGSPHALLATAALETGGRPAGDLAPVLRSLVRARPAAAPAAAPALLVSEAEALLRQLAGKPPAEQERLLLGLVRSSAATVLGHPGPEAVRPDIGFMEAEFDSLGVIELRNRINTVTGLRLPTTALFDHPTPSALAAHLRERLVPDPPPAAAPEPAPAPAPEPLVTDDLAERIADVGDDEIFDFLHNELGIS